MSESKTIQIGPSGLTVLTIVLVLLKVYGKIDWSWWWIFAPLWLPAVIVLGIFLLALILAVWADS